MAERTSLFGRCPPPFETYVVENALKFPRGYVEVGKYTWTQPVEDEITFKDGIYILNVAISRRLVPSKVTYLDAGRNCPPEDQGRILMIAPGSRVRATAPAGQLRSMQCVLDGAMIDAHLRHKPQWDEQQLRDAAHLDSPDLEWPLLRIYRELREPGFASELMVEELLNAICIELVRRLRFDDAEEIVRKGGLPQWRMRLLRERAFADLPLPSLAELAELCDLSARQLRRAFKTETGQAISKFIEATAVERARALLVGGHSVNAVSAKLGFANTSSFSHAFRRATGLRPSEVGRHRVRHQ